MVDLGHVGLAFRDAVQHSGTSVPVDVMASRLTGKGVDMAIAGLYQSHPTTVRNWARMVQANPVGAETALTTIFTGVDVGFDALLGVFGLHDFHDKSIWDKALHNAAAKAATETIDRLKKIPVDDVSEPSGLEMEDAKADLGLSLKKVVAKPEVWVRHFWNQVREAVRDDLIADDPMLPLLEEIHEATLRNLGAIAAHPTAEPFVAALLNGENPWLRVAA